MLFSELLFASDKKIWETIAPSFTFTNSSTPNLSGGYCKNVTFLVNNPNASQIKVILWHSTNDGVDYSEYVEVQVPAGATNFPITVFQTGTYKAQWNNSATDIHESSPIYVKIDLLPIINISNSETSGVSNNDGIICKNKSVTLTASGSSLSYTWNTGENTSIITTTLVSTYTFTATGTDINGCVNSLSKVINVLDLPIVSAITGSDNVCEGLTTTLSNSTTGGVWSSTSPIFANINTSGLVTGLSSGTSSITYTVTDGNSCSTTVNKSFTVNALPSVSSITGASEVCEGLTTTLSHSTNGGVWSTTAQHLQA